MQKIKILHIIKSLGRGGAEMLLPETLKLHSKDKFEFHYIYFLPWKNQLEAVIKEGGGRVTCLPSTNNFKLLMQYKKVVSYCRKENIDLIHCHLPWAGFLGRIVFKKINIPVLYTEHNMQERYHSVTKNLNKLSYNAQSMAFGVSQDVTRSIKENISPKIQVTTLLNGVNTEKFVRKENISAIREEYKIPQNAIVIGNVAVFRFQKRLIEWLRVFKRIQEKNESAFGIIVGAGPLESEIINEVKKLELEKKVFFPGLQTNVKPYFEAMDIFMMSSSFEGLPIALLEAMSMECAVIATDAGGIKEVIREGVDGLTCKVEEWERLVILSQVLIDDPQKLKKFKIAARNRVVENFSLVKMVSQLEEYYLEVVYNK